MVSAIERTLTYPLSHFGLPGVVFPMDEHKAALNRSVARRIYQRLTEGVIQDEMSYLYALDGMAFFPCFSYDDRLLRIKSSESAGWSDAERAAIRHFLTDTLGAISQVASCRCSHNPFGLRFRYGAPAGLQVEGDFDPVDFAALSALFTIGFDFAADFDTFLPIVGPPNRWDTHPGLLSRNDVEYGVKELR
ncbi:MAG: hypothetical protein WKF37_17755 [Bryobacteraceae bacterium]